MRGETGGIRSRELDPCYQQCRPAITKSGQEPLFDLTGSYTISFALAVVALLGASLLSFGIAERRYSVRYITPVHRPRVINPTTSLE